MRLPERKSKLDWERIDAVIQSAVKPLGSPRNENPLALDMGSVNTSEIKIPNSNASRTKRGHSVKL